MLARTSMLQTTQAAQERWTERVGAPRVTLTPSVFPRDAVAVIYRPTRSAMTSGRARTRQWKLRFERRSPGFVEPLMGWTGGEDPLAQVELTFPSAEAAVAYARRQGLRFVLRNDGGVAGANVARGSPLMRSKPASGLLATCCDLGKLSPPSSRTASTRIGRDDWGYITLPRRNGWRSAYRAR
jgi:hypothetical protein